MAKHKLYLVTTIVLMCLHFIQAQVTVSKQDSLIYDANGNLLANPGDSLRYKTKIKNTSGGTVTGAALDINASGNLNANPGSFKSSPLALDDAYGVTGNVGIMVPAGSGLLINDFDDAPGLLTVLAEMKPTAMGGSVTINADGSFSYTPAAGFTGSDNFTYTLQDGNELPGYPAVNHGLVTLNVANMLWFIDNGSVAATSDGRLNSPFKTLANFNASAGPQTGQIVFVKNTGTNYTGGIVLKDNQTLWGTGHTGGANLANVLPFMLAPNSFALPAINGTSPVIENAGGDGVTMAMNNALRGFNVGNCSDFGMDNNGTNSIGNLNVVEVNINNGTGGGFDAGNGSGGSMNAVFGSISSTGGVNGVNLVNCAGTFTGNGGTITNPTGTGVVISGGSVVFSYSGAVTDNTGFVIDIDNHDSGNATFSGNITSTGTGIRVQNCNGGTKTFSGSSKSLTTTTNNGVTLSSNTGATISFTGGGLVISTTSGVGFNATGGGMVNVTGTGNTISSVSATALNVASTTIGASNLNFQSISSGNNTAAADPANGIVLNNTGSDGGLIVTGTGSAASGGTIQHCSSIGISLTSTRNVSLTRMQLNDFLDYAVRGTSVINFTMDNTVVNGVNGDNAASDEGSIRFTELTGSATISNCNISGGFEDNFQLDNSTGTLNRITFSNTTIGANSTTDGNDGITLEATGSAVVNVTVQNGFFTSARGDLFQLNLLGNSSSDLIFSGNALSNNHPAIATGGGGVTISGGDNTGTGSNLTFNIANNTFKDADGHAILIVKSTDPGSFSGTFSGNQIGLAGTANSGSKAGSGIKIQSAGLGTVTVAVTNNQIRQYNNFGIELLTGGGATAQSGNLFATVTGNTVSNPGTGGLPMNGVHLNGGTVPGDTYFICTHISGNSITGSGANGGTDFRLRQRQSTTVRLPGYAGSNIDDTAVVNFVSGNNSGASGLASHNVPPGGGFVGGAACNLP